MLRYTPELGFHTTSSISYLPCTWCQIREVGIVRLLIEGSTLGTKWAKPSRSKAS